MNKLTAKKCRAQIKEWEKMMLISDVSMMIEYHLEAYRIALRVLEQQEKGDDGWIEWKGGECPVDIGVLVEFEMRDGDKNTALSTILDWSHELRSDDIIAYRVIENDGREG